MGNLLRTMAIGAFRAAARVTGRRGFARLLRGGVERDPAFFSEALAESLAVLDARGLDTVLPQDVENAVLVSRLRVACDRADSPVYSHHVYAEMSQCCRRLRHEPTRVLEIGPGSSLGALTCFLAGGASSAAAVDVEPLHGDRTEFYRELGRYLAVVGGFGWWRNFSTTNETKHRLTYAATWDAVDVVELAKRIDYRAPQPSHVLPFEDGAFDFAYSVAALEHVERVRETLAEIKRVLAPGGLTVHEIDLRQHGPSDDLLRFLRWTQAEYEQRTQQYGGGKGIDSIIDGSWTGEVYCNRLRMSDWHGEFERSGLEIVAVERLCDVDAASIDVSKLAPPFAGKTIDDLRAVMIRVVARKR
jgi:SAM-dependent methyltransferase